MIERVITGGQSGADQAGWRAAKAAGIATGGWMPKGFLTEEGPRPEFAEMYGAKETPSQGYVKRTEWNVRDADWTAFFGDVDSPGAKATYRAFRKRYDRGLDPGRHYVRERWTPIVDYPSGGILYGSKKFAEWMNFHGVKVLNIAGNRESSAPGIGQWVEAYLTEVFRLLREAP